MKILAISGSLRAASHNTALLRAAAELAPEGVEIELYENLEALPPYTEDRDTDEPPAEVQRLRDAIADADAVLFSTPEYNTTIPGQLKQVVDWGSRPHRQSVLWGKPAAAVGVSVTDYGAIWAQDHLRRALGIAGARVLDQEFLVARAGELFDADGELTDQATRERLGELIDDVVAHHHAYAVAA